MLELWKLWAELMRECERLEKEVKDLQDDNAQLRVKLTEVVTDLRRYERSGICLPGWWCVHCKGFNGEAKQEHKTCVYCTEPKSQWRGPGCVGYDGTYVYTPEE